MNNSHANCTDEAHEMFHRFGCGLWWQMMICCIKDYSSCTCLSFLSSSWVFKEFCTFSMHFFKAGQLVLLSSAALWWFESACTGPVQNHKFTVIYASFFIWVELLLLWNALELNSWWIECIFFPFRILGWFSSIVDCIFYFVPFWCWALIPD